MGPTTPPTIDELVDANADELANIEPAGPTTIELARPITREVGGESQTITSLDFDWLRWSHIVELPIDTSVANFRALAVVAARMSGVAVVGPNGEASPGPIGLVDIVDWSKISNHVARALVPLKLSASIDVGRLSEDQIVYLEANHEISDKFPSELKLRRLRAGDVFGVRLDPRLMTFREMLEVCASASDQSRELLGRMTMADVGKCARILTGFFALLQPETFDAASEPSPSD